MADQPTIRLATTAADIAAVRVLCWDYRAFLLANSPIDRELTETFYPVPKYKALMADLPVLHARPRGVMLLARLADGTPVACGMSHPLDAETSEIKRVFVAPGARGTGLAKTLCRALIEQARADGYGRVVLDTSRTLEAAGPLYLRLGFAERDPYQPIPDHALPHLRFFEHTLTNKGVAQPERSTA